MASMSYLTIESLGTALKIFAPAAILSWFYKHDTFVFRILQHCDKAIRSVLFNRSDHPDDILKWMQDIFPYDDRTKSLELIWNNGSIISDLVECVVPGSYDRKKSTEKTDFGEGQLLAEQYLGVNAIFSKEDLTVNTLSKQHERRLIFYLNSIRDALNRLSPPISRTGSPILNTQAYNLDYVARGMGLFSAAKTKKSSFYIYPTAHQGLEPAEISIHIKGPGGCYGSTLISPIYGRSHIILNVLKNLQTQNSALPLPIACNSFVNHRRDENYFTSKIVNDIDVVATTKNDKVKVSYVPNTIGSHELSIITKGCHLIGSPYRINVETECANRTESHDLEDEDDSMDKSNRSDRKIVFKIVDFVTEKMILTDDGQLEKISNEDVETLLHTVESMENIATKYLQNNNETTPHSNDKMMISKQNFNKIVKKVLLMLHICKELRQIPLMNNNHLEVHTSVPDIINSANKAKEKRSYYKNKYQSFNQTSEDRSIEHEDSRLITIAKDHTPLIDIVISSFDDGSLEDNPVVTNPTYERPKTPIFKILDSDDEAEVRKKSAVIDFHIGEPVTPTNYTNSVNIEGDMDSIILSSNLEEALIKYDNKIQKKDPEQYNSEDSGSSLFTTPLRHTPFEQMTDNEIIKMYDYYSDDDSSDDLQKISYTVDSAYISIDDMNTSPDTANSPRSDSKLVLIEETDREDSIEQLDEEEFSRMGPAEQELWRSITENVDEINFNIHNHYPKIIQNHKCPITPIDENEIYTKKDVSTSDYTADAIQSNGTQEITSIQINAELQDVNCTKESTKKISKMVSEKKNYWDERIKSIEIDETKQPKTPKKISPDIKPNQTKVKKVIEYTDSFENINSESPILYKVSNWRDYWDEKLEKKSKQCTESSDDDNTSVNPIDIPRKLSERIDEYLETVSNPSPVKEQSRFSTPDADIRKSIIHHDYQEREYNSLDPIMRIEKDNNRIIVKWNENQLDGKTKIFEDLTNQNQSTPMVYMSLDSGLNNNMSMDSSYNDLDIKTNDSVKYVSNVKSKIEEFNENRIDKARQAFISNKSKTVDFPRNSSFKNLQRYFSIRSMESLNTLEKFEIKTKPIRRNDSLPTLAEKRAILEAHLILMQKNRPVQCERIEYSQSTKSLPDADTPDKVKDIVKYSSRIDLKSELKGIAKPINLLVAAFENQSNNKSMSLNNISNQVKVQDAVSLKGTTGPKIDTLSVITDIDNKHKKNSKDIITEHPLNSIENDLKQEVEESDEHINSDNYKERFKKTKMFFQSLHVDKGSQNKINECQELLLDAIKKTDNDKPRLKMSFKAYSSPASNSESEYRRFIWKNQGKLLNLSEKYLVEDLFKDIVGDSNRMGLKGIPHKDAVLATFKSMESINQLSSYDYSRTQINDLGRKSYSDVFTLVNENRQNNSGCLISRDYAKLSRARRYSAPPAAR